MLVQAPRNAISGLIAERRDAIKDAWVKSVASSSRGRMSSAEADKELVPMLDAMIAGIRKSGGLDSSNPAFDETRALLSEFSRTRARTGFSPSETAIAVFALKDAVLLAVQDAGGDVFVEYPKFSKFVDDLGLITFEAYAKAREDVISNQTEQLLELSTPVVKLWDGIVAVPLVGTLDSARTQVVMESLLQTLVATGSSHAIIDITGVPAVDTQVAQHLMKAVVAARLMGADCVISGIRPQIAQTIVSIGVEFGDVVTKANLADALKLTLQRSGLEVRRVERKQ
jgi:rsbT co-antagonist protein RsbR